MVDITVYAYHFLARQALSTSYGCLRKNITSVTNNSSYHQVIQAIPPTLRDVYH